MANGVDPDRTAVCSWSTPFASIFNLSVILNFICSRRLQLTTFSYAFFFLGALRFNVFITCPLFYQHCPKDMGHLLPSMNSIGRTLECGCKH